MPFISPFDGTLIDGIDESIGSRMLELLNEANPGENVLGNPAAFFNLVNQCIATLEAEVGRRLNKAELVFLALQWRDSIVRQRENMLFVSPFTGETIHEVYEFEGSRMLELLNEANPTVNEIMAAADFVALINRCIAAIRNEVQEGRQLNEGGLTWLAKEWRDAIGGQNVLFRWPNMPFTDPFDLEPVDHLEASRMLELLNEANPTVNEIWTRAAFFNLINQRIAHIEGLEVQQPNWGALVFLAIMQWRTSIGRQDEDE